MTGKDLIKIIEDYNLFDVNVWTETEEILFDLAEHKTNKKDRYGEDVLEYIDFVIDTHTGETRLNAWNSDV